MAKQAATYQSRRYALRNLWDPRHLGTIDKLMTFEPGDRVLELGCGRGHLTKRLQQRGLDATGVDANPECVEVGVTSGLRQMFAQDLDFPDEHFDALVSFHMIEHVPPIREAFVEMHRVLRPGAHALLVYPAEPIRGAYSWPASIIMYKTPFRARDIHVHRLNPSKVQTLAHAAGFEHVHSEFHLRFTPEYATVLRRP